MAAGLTDILIITGRGKRAIEDHFDRNFELEHSLEQSEKLDLLAEVQDINELADIHYIRQRDPLGLGHAVSVAREHVGDEPFAVILGDDIMVDDGELLRSMIDVHEREDASVLALLEVDARTRSRRTAARSPTTWATACAASRGVVEKPRAEDAKSNLAVIGRYVFTPGIFDALDRITPGVGGELQLTDAIGLLLATEAGVRPGVHPRPLRHRPEARLPARQHRARARPPRPRPRARRLPPARWCAAIAARRDPAGRGAGRDLRRGGPASRRSTPSSRDALGLVLAERVTAPRGRARRSPTPRWTATRCGRRHRGRGRGRAGAVAGGRRARGRARADRRRRRRARRSAS